MKPAGAAAATATVERAVKREPFKRKPHVRQAGPTRGLLEALHAHGGMPRAELWALASKMPTPPRSKRHMKRVLHDAVRRNMVMAVADTRRISEKLAGAKKILPPKQLPPFLFKMKGERRYKLEDKKEDKKEATEMAGDSVKTKQ
jgi:hypothetical protein